MINTINMLELERACDFLELDFRYLRNGKAEIVGCEIQYPFEDCPTDEFAIINQKVVKGQELSKKIKELRECRERQKQLQSEIKLLTRDN